MKTHAIARLQAVAAIDKAGIILTMKNVAKGLKKLGAGRVLETEKPVGNTGSLVMEPGSLSAETLGSWLLKQGFVKSGKNNWTKWTDDADAKVNIDFSQGKAMAWINVFVQSGLINYRQFLVNRSKRPQYQPPAK